MRVTRGIFVRPKISSLLGKLSSKPLKIVEDVILRQRGKTPNLVGKIRRKLGEEEFEALKAVIILMPALMRVAMLENDKVVENAQFEAEARSLADRVPENQLRFLKVAKAKGKAMEPVGRMAGVLA